MKTFKAFDKDLKCRGYQFEVGKTYSHEGEVKICESGFHSCENPLDVLNYYDLTESRFCIVDVEGDVKTHKDDSKIASAKITISEELKLPDYIKSCVDYLLSKCIEEDSQLAASGYNSKLAASGYNSKLAASGYNSQLAASGDYSQLAASGNYSKLAASGDHSQLAASGNYSKLAVSGHNSKLAASGHNSQLAASGYNSQLAASGNCSIACNAGTDGRVKCGTNGAMSLSYFDNEEKRYRIVVAYVGEEGIKPDTWYMLDENHKFTECE